MHLRADIPVEKGPESRGQQLNEQGSRGDEGRIEIPSEQT